MLLAFPSIELSHFHVLENTYRRTSGDNCGLYAQGNITSSSKTDHDMILQCICTLLS